ncbi:pectinesterase [Exidia glandulosa HHB12029]|uniref:pectinesterase n=1 Tax=Exidia glandulosa HHB12029 TaxID=1314781 RepID=A0A165KRM1_EXIGL|nr:pectinesterase [Exidia glandulosa HHB12029]
MLGLLVTLLSAASCALAATRTSPPSGAVVVRQSGTQSGEFSTVSAAVASLSGTSSRSIFIYPGSYKEQVLIEYKGPLTIYGYTNDTTSYKNNQVTITNNLNAQDNGGNDPCATVRAHSASFNMYNINVANTYGQGKQATALATKAGKQGYYGCKFTGYQDTLLADGGDSATQYYSNCYIQGAVDYVYGSASAWFGEECTFDSIGGGAITANSRDSTASTSYYVIDSSTITSTSSTSLTSKVYLGRPWRQYARVVFQRSKLPALINPAGWTTLANPANPIFMEFNNTGDGSSTASRVNETKQTALIDHGTVLGSDYSTWVDTSY